MGESAGIKGEELQIKFVEVTEDSRCPTGVVCVFVCGKAESVVSWRSPIENLYTV